MNLKRAVGLSLIFVGILLAMGNSRITGNAIGNSAQVSVISLIIFFVGLILAIFDLESEL